MSGRRLLVMFAASSAIAAAEGGDPWREVLREQPPPWYDANADAWRRIEVRERDRPAPAGSGPGGAGIGGDLVAVLIIAALVVAAILVARQLLRLLPQTQAQTRTAAAIRSQPPPDLSSLPLPDAGLPPDEGLRRAIAAGDWRRATVWVHARLLVRLDAAGVLRLERGSTERTLLAAARTWAAAHPAGAPAARALERTGAAFAAVYFGHADADRTLVDRLLEADRAAEQALAAAGAA